MEDLGWAGYLGASDSLVSLRILGRYPVKVQDILRDATFAFEKALIATGYENPCDYIGSYLKRPIAGTDIWSTHSYGVAIDLDYGGDNPESPDHPGVDYNPHLHRPIRDEDFGLLIQLEKHQVEAVEAIRNLDGHQMWRWLGWSIGDSMHFQINVPPRFTQVDWATVAGEEQEDMTYEQMRAAEFDLWTDANIMEAFDAGMFEDTNRVGFHDYWVVKRDERTAPQKARFITDYYAHLWKRD